MPSLLCCVVFMKDQAITSGKGSNHVTGAAAIQVVSESVYFVSEGVYLVSEGVYLVSEGVYFVSEDYV